ncbi:unnamed protein product, partial [Penicillium pancosmium]
MSQRPPTLKDPSEDRKGCRDLLHWTKGLLRVRQDYWGLSRSSPAIELHCQISYSLTRRQLAFCDRSVGWRRAIRNPTSTFPTGRPSKGFSRTAGLIKGPLPTSEHMWDGVNEWGAGMLDGDLFVGFSRAGCVFVCSAWRKAIRDPAGLAAHSSLIECKSGGSSFDLGGWLSVQNHRLMFEIQDRIYVVALDDQNRIQDANGSSRASYSLITSSAPQLAVPVSFMTLCDDAIMTTYT